MSFLSRPLIRATAVALMSIGLSACQTVSESPSDVPLEPQPQTQRGPEATWALFSGAVERNRADVVSDLLKEGVTPNLFVNQGDPALVRAIRLENWDVVFVLMQAKDLDVAMRSELGEDALMLAAFKGNEPLVVDLLKRGAPVQSPSGWTALHYAATNGHVGLMRLLLSKGADVNARTASGITPLYMAARKPSRDAVLLLMRAGALRDICNDQNQSPADAARKAGDLELADYLAVPACASPEKVAKYLKSKQH
ncbi:MAG: ankyrin repeat domain-containing protein [Duodenibacillus sp.]|nr:ankyrin repeat domain-containing protein [Duodenibacillus sp.]